jgi:hypothetical protein
VAGETVRTVHVVTLPTEGQAGVVSALCGAVLMLEDIETVNPGEGMPCTACVVHRMTGPTPTGQPPADGPESADAVGCGTGGVAYQGWGWPVTLHRDQVRLSLDREVSALAIPVPLAIEATRILATRGCSAPVLTHPYGHRRFAAAAHRHPTRADHLDSSTTAGFLARVPRDRSLWGVAHRAARLPSGESVTWR